MQKILFIVLWLKSSSSCTTCIKGILENKMLLLPLSWKQDFRDSLAVHMSKAIQMYSDVLLTVHLSIFILVINQLYAQHFCFTISLFPSLYIFRANILNIRRSKLHYTVFGIITPMGVMIHIAWCHWWKGKVKQTLVSEVSRKEISICYGSGRIFL